MRILVLADIHSNLAALETVLAAAGEFDQVWCLGDLVGYGPDPNECIQRIRELPHLCVAGNHDWGALNKLDTNDFNFYARQACLWNRAQLTQENYAFLNGLDEKLVAGHFTLAHGSPCNPIWEYLMPYDPEAADLNLECFETPYCFVGHTHMPAMFVESHGRCTAFRLIEDQPMDINDAHLIINPGGVGQPRDGDPRAAYILLDTETLLMEHHRVEYPIEVTQSKMREVGLPRPLIDRLAIGH